MDREEVETKSGPTDSQSVGPSPASGGVPEQVAADRRAVGYIRLSPGERKDAAEVNGRARVGAGLADQRAKIVAEVERRGWSMVRVFGDPEVTGKHLNRPGLVAALDMLDAGGADVLVAAKLERLARSTIAFGQLLERADRGDWSIVVLDFQLDTSTAAGRLVANVMAAVAQWEREAIGERTRDALAVKKAQGVHVGRRSVLPAEVAARIRRERADGVTLRVIAEGLNRDGVATGQGGARWYASSVAAVLRSVLAGEYLRQRVGGVAVEVVPGSVVAAGGARVGVPGERLDVSEGDVGVERGGDS